MASLSGVSAEDIEYINLRIAKLKLLKTLIKRDVDKPRKPLRRRVSKKCTLIHNDYLDIIEKFDVRNEMLLIAIDVIITVHEKLLK